MENITTGNWKADSIIQGHVAVGKLLVASAHCGTTHSSSVGIDAKEMLANAHLIAAAPDMYAELKASTNRLQTVVDSILTDGMDDRRRNILKQIGYNKAALAKARGV